MFYLTSPDKLYQRQGARTFWFGSLVAVSARGRPDRVADRLAGVPAATGTQRIEIQFRLQRLATSCARQSHRCG